MLPDMLTHQMSTASLPSPAHRLLAALRAAVLIHNSGQDPRERLAMMLGGRAQATAWMILLDSISAAWPDPMVLCRPCCRATTHDEVTVIEMIAHAASGNRPAFDAQLRDMIDEDGRNLIYAAANRFVATFVCHSS